MNIFHINRQHPIIETSQRVHYSKVHFHRTGTIWRANACVWQSPMPGDVFLSTEVLELEERLCRGGVYSEIKHTYVAHLSRPRNYQ